MRLINPHIKYLKSRLILVAITFLTTNHLDAQCDPSTIDLCDIGNNNIIQACYHAQIAKTSNGYSITGEDFAPTGTTYATALTNIPGPRYPMPLGIAPLWGAIGGRTQAVFLGTDEKIYAVGEEDLLIDASLTDGPAWGETKLQLPAGITVCDVSKWQGTAGSGSDNNNNSNVTGDRDGFLVFSTIEGEAYITGDGASAIQLQARNNNWTQINMPVGVTVINFGVGYRTLLILGSDGNLYASGPETYLGDGTKINLTEITLLATQPNISVFGISQIEAGFNSYFVLDGDGTVHVLGENSEGALGIGNESDLTTWSKVGRGCSSGILDQVAYISTMSTHDNRISSSAILVNGTIRSWGSNNKQSITTGDDKIITCPITPTGINRNAVAISNGGHISPYVNTNVQICNIGHNRQGAFGDGNDEQGDYGEYDCRIIPGMPEICGTKEANLELNKSVSDQTPSTGDDIVFILTVTNKGPDPSTGSFVRDQLDPAFYYVSDDSNGKYNSSTGLWTVGPLAVGESKTINITVKVIKAGIHSNYAQVLVDNEVDINSTPGDNSIIQDDDDRVNLDVTICPMDSSDIILCPGDSIEIGLEWVYESGMYIESIPVALDCDSLHISQVLYVEEPPIPQLEVDCEDMTYYLSVDAVNNWQPSWDNGDNTYQTTYNSSFDQAVLSLGTDPNCMEQTIIDLPPLPDFDEIPILNDTLILENTLLEVSTGLDPQEWQITWEPEWIVDCNTCLEETILADESTQVTLYLEHISGCAYESSFFLEVEKLPEHIYVPNVFTPDKSTNNTWSVFTSDNISIQECNIYDRWGNLVYHSDEGQPLWNGYINGKKPEQGVYVYLINYLDSYDEEQVLSGGLTLLR